LIVKISFTVKKNGIHRGLIWPGNPVTNEKKKASKPTLKEGTFIKHKIVKFVFL